jgi:rhodanese-related sulfurtransferase
MVVRVNPEQARKLIESGAVEVIDVREPAEWARGHVPGARLVELAAVRSGAASLPADSILFVCAGGVRSQTAARYALERGVTRVYSLTGGTQSWIKAGLPLANELSVAV